MAKRAQTSIEYMLLISSVILFTAIIAITVRDLITPAGEISQDRAAEIQIKKGEYGVQPTAIIDKCNPGSYCGITYYPENSVCPAGQILDLACIPQCQRICLGDGSCGNCASVPTCTPECHTPAGPVCVSLTVTPATIDEGGNAQINVDFDNLQGSTTQIDCGNGDHYTVNLDSFGRATQTCHYEHTGTFTVSARHGGIDCPVRTVTVTHNAPTCEQITSDRNNQQGPFTAIITADFENVADNTPATLKCNQTDPGLIVQVNSERATRSCVFSLVNTARTYQISADLGSGSLCASNVNVLATAPTCNLITTPSSGTGPFSSAVAAVFTNLERSVTTANMKCSSADPGIVRPISSNIASTTCNYAAVAADTTYVASATAGLASCSANIIDKTVPVPSCVLIANPVLGMGQMQSRLTAIFYNYPGQLGNNALAIQCHPGDIVNTKVNNIIFSSNAAYRDCSYDPFGRTRTFRANASAMGITCETQVTTENPQSVSCNYLACDLANRNAFYDFVVNPNYGGSPPSIEVLDNSVSCNAGGGVCKGNNQCRVKGAYNGGDICSVIEDLDDYDWNDFAWSTHTIQYNAWQSLLEITRENCDSAAPDGLTLVLNFSGFRNVTRLNDLRINSTQMTMQVWPSCRDPNYANTIRFFISEYDPPNLPPTWYSFPDQWPQTMSSSTWDVNLWIRAYDDLNTASQLTYTMELVSSDPSIVSCSILGNRYLHCGPVNKPGSVIAIIRATDTSGLYSTQRVNIIARQKMSNGLVFGSVGGTSQLDLNTIVSNPRYPPVRYLFDILNQTNTTVSDCMLTNNTNYFTNSTLNCKNYIPGTSLISVKVTDPDNSQTQNVVTLNVN